MMGNSGQTCSAGSRLLVPAARMDEAIKAAARRRRRRHRRRSQGQLSRWARWSPRRQYNIIQDYIQKGIDEGAQLIAGGLGRPEGLDKGWYRQADRVRRRPTTWSSRARRSSGRCW